MKEQKKTLKKQFSFLREIRIDIISRRKSQMQLVVKENVGGGNN